MQEIDTEQSFEQKTKITANPENILSAWIDLEVLSVSDFSKPEEFAANRDKKLIFNLSNTEIPWEEPLTQLEKGKSLYYKIALGTLDLKQSYELLINKFAENRINKPQGKKKTIIASLIIDQNGVLVKPFGITLSSFAWGVGQILNNEVDNLYQWLSKERAICNEMESRLSKVDENDEDILISFPLLRETLDWLIEELKIPEALANPIDFGVKSVVKKDNRPNGLIINSFLIKDLIKAKDLYQNKKQSRIIDLYLGHKKPIKRVNIYSRNRNENIELKALLSPSKIPLSKWPGKDRFPLVLMQQAAVNAVADLPNSDYDILAVNGPPGTGKTTLLRDVIADIVYQRAKVMSSYSDPLVAFTKSDKEMKTKSGSFNLYELDEVLKGFEIVIACSNNKAAENISNEIPDMNSIASDEPELRYFKSISDHLTNKETWGLISAVLGNSKNKQKFKDLFWWDKEEGLLYYLLEASGKSKNRYSNQKDSSKTKPLGKPNVVEKNSPSTNREEALSLWQKAKEEFLLAQKKCEDSINELIQIESSLKNFNGLKIEKERIKGLVPPVKEEVESLKEKWSTIKTKISDINKDLERLNNNITLQNHRKPNSINRLFKSKVYRAWEHECETLNKQNKFLTKSKVETEQTLEKLRLYLEERESEFNSLSVLQTKVENSFNESSKLLELAYLQIKEHIIDDSFFKNDRDQIQKSVPWCNQEVNKFREELFVKSIKLHKAFIDVAAEPIRHNIAILLMSFSKKDDEYQSIRNNLTDLWSSLFLVVPSISTTFASIHSMFEDAKSDSIGWLLVDEAGQSLPQEAIGALLRAKKAVIVGDPLQIEPVVTLPEKLIQKIANKHSVPFKDFFPPYASCQTMADDASPYYASIGGRNGDRKLGLPLLVHRRCDNPMFEISNGIAYEGFMVSANESNNSPIRNCLGGSSWVHVDSVNTEGKWSEEEGNVIVNILLRLRNENVDPDLYIITPFVDVKEKLREVLKKSKVLSNWIQKESEWISKRVGTVHTVQGRESEAVIFVLGASSPDQSGARKWAGQYPNLLNVAVTRAKEAFYVVGDQSVWGNEGVFKELSTAL